MVQKLRCEVAPPFIICCPSNLFKGDASFSSELFNNKSAYSFFIVRGETDFLRSPMDIDLIGRKAKIRGYSES
jgi:hypothetical protein